MKKDETFIDIRITGNEEDVMELCKMFSYIQKMCKIGASRGIKLSVDGDGSANVDFNIITDNGKSLKPFPNIKDDLDASEYKFGLGA